MPMVLHILDGPVCLHMILRFWIRLRMVRMFRRLLLILRMRMLLLISINVVRIADVV